MLKSSSQGARNEKILSRKYLLLITSLYICLITRRGACMGMDAKCRPAGAKARDRCWSRSKRA